jgi:hypothetical protein
MVKNERISNVFFQFLEECHIFVQCHIFVIKNTNVTTVIKTKHFLKERNLKKKKKKKKSNHINKKYSII